MSTGVFQHAPNRGDVCAVMGAGREGFVAVPRLELFSHDTVGRDVCGRLGDGPWRALPDAG